jgi:hypothetical protein
MRASSKVEFNAGMSRDNVIRALLGFLLNQFKEPLEVAAEFGEGYAAPAEGAKRTIAERFAQRVLTDEDLDVGFSLNQEEAGAQTPRAVATDAPGGAREAASVRATRAEATATP